MRARPRLILPLAGLLISMLAFTSAAWLSAQARPLNRGESTAPAGCGVVSCTTYLPVLARGFPAPWPIEVTQGVQQPDNSVTLIQDRPTFVRLTITSTTPHTGVSAYLRGTRGGAPLPGSPIPAINNPRTLESSADRAVLNDTFNFELPASWLNGTITLYGAAANGTTFDVTGGSSSLTFVNADPLRVTVLPISYVCTSGGSGTTTPQGPYTYLTEYTYHTYPVPSLAMATHAALVFNGGPCTPSGVPDPDFYEWDTMLDLVTTVWVSEGRPDSYYYGLVKVYCGSSCIAGIGWIGYSKAAVGFDGVNAGHSGAGPTHAHEVGHNHGRSHAPGCGALGIDPTFPYVSGGRGYIGNSANPNFGFDVGTQTIYPYSPHYDFMGYCDPAWISDYTYEALRGWNQAHGAGDRPGVKRQRVMLVSGRLGRDGSMAISPVYTLDARVLLPEPGDHTLELLDAAGRIVAAYPFAPAQAVADRWRAGTAFERAGFHMALPYVDGVNAIRVRRGATVLGLRQAGLRKPSLVAGRNALITDGQSVVFDWLGSDSDGETPVYLVRASTDGGASWQTIGVNLTTPSIQLSLADFAGESVLVEVLGSDGLHTTSLTLGPYNAPAYDN